MPRIVPPILTEIERAADRLRRGGIVAFPTETVYGLGADLFKARAMQKVFALKGRPADNPLIAHVTGAEQAREKVVAEWDERCEQLATRFWPGPLTLVLPKSAEVPEIATAGRSTIAVRAPDHAVARALLESFGGVIAAPSANRSGHVSPTRAEHVADDFASESDLLILDGGACAIGIESTVLDVTVDPAIVLRPGAVTAEALRGLIGEVDSPAFKEQAASPGTSPQHYAPRTHAIVLDREEIARRLGARDEPIAAIVLEPPSNLSPTEGCHVFTLPRDPEAYAASLYAVLRQADASDTVLIVIERPPEDDARWRAVRDRLNRAASG